jgi:RES domain-containing protein
VPQLCVACVRDRNLKALIERQGIDSTCVNCGETRRCLDTESDDFFQLTKALVRFHFSEWEYNTHWGGDGYESLFYGEDNVFFDPGRSLSEDAYDDLVTSITCGDVYEDYDKGVSIFAGYGQGGVQNLLLESLKSDLDPELLSIARQLKDKNHFDLEQEAKQIISRYCDVARLPLEKGFELFRARVGCEDKRRLISGGFETEYHFSPYADAEIGAPPPYLASSGRVNRSGVSFFYSATDEYTAVAEVRPHPADKVSVAKFQLISEIAVFDLSDSKLIDFFSSDKKLKEYLPLNTLGVLLNRTIPPSERTQYSITQLIADCIRQLGFDGIIFNSTVGAGKNVVLFDGQLAKIVSDAYTVVEVESVQYTYAKRPLVNEKDRYDLPPIKRTPKSN